MCICNVISTCGNTMNLGDKEKERNGMNIAQRVGKFYTGVIMKNIGIFIFIGLLSVVFQEDGWFPNENMYAVSQFAYYYVLPCLIAFAGGNAVGGHIGGVLSVLALCGLLSVDRNIGLFGAMLSGPLGGYVWKWECRLLEKRRYGINLQMLFRNLCVGVTGCILAAIEYYFIAELLTGFAEILSAGIRFLIQYNSIALLNILIEPAKIFFMNNMIHHSILVPLGMNQVQEIGSSCLFLLESNPGPGLGVLAALFWKYKQRREEYAAAIFTQSVGGIHEVYFPYVLENLKLLIPLILGGMAGSFCFVYLDCGVKSVVSPGSVITIFLMGGKGMALPLFAGILLSTFVSFFGSVVLLAKKKEFKPMKEERKEEENRFANLKKIGFVCDGGMGSSAMGAALFRRILAERNILGLEVAAYASDLIPEDVDLIVCQEDFYRIAGKRFKEKNCYTVTSLVKKEEYENLAEQIKQKNQ